MSHGKGLSRKQTAVLNDLFQQGLDEPDALAKHKVSAATYETWLADEQFAAEFQRRMQAAYRQGELIIARYANMAAANLVHLTNSKNQETARKACLDVINFRHQQRSQPEHRNDEPGLAETHRSTELSPELAARLLAALAEENGDAGQQLQPQRAVGKN